jgi:hypothetical protein
MCCMPLKAKCNDRRHWQQALGANQRRESGIGIRAGLLWMSRRCAATRSVW